MKITLRDEDASNEEKQFLVNFAKRLSITDEEYVTISNTYTSHEIKAPHLYEQRLDALYEIVKIVCTEDTLSPESKEIWLKRVGKALGFDPSNVKYIVAKSLDVFADNINVTKEYFMDEVKNLNQ
ncbi:hypothetical protein GCM10011444_12930 [Winogradskyella haliclonae]|uniref:TerB family tellurite resistance protein n=2 Tax=Winogradskyella haliclonae TaxID=2048558 RepID=A0ABQ2BXN6_9FLAO|nr:hypothetical protein GCM10011444_12930 [Winogradskyella haliclonae]